MAENLRRAAAERCFVAREAGPMPRFSFEYFPPAAPAAEERFRATVRRLGALAPEFVSVPYGAGSRTQERPFTAHDWGRAQAAPDPAAPPTGRATGRGGGGQR